MALEENEFGRNTGTLNGYKIDRNAKLKGADLSGADLRNVYLDDANLEGAILIGADLTDAFLAGANLKGANLTGANLTDAFLSDAKLQGAILTDAILVKAYFDGANLNNANLKGADLTEATLSAKMHNAILEDANLTNATLFNAELHNANLVNANLYGANVAFANFSGADLTGANWENIRGLDRIRSLEGIIFPTPASRLARSYGAMTGPILKLCKSDSPAKASEFKRRYPAEFERLKGDTGGRDFTESMKESLREKYATPFDWVITKQKYRSKLQRFSPDPNHVIVLNVDTRDHRFTDEQRALFSGLDNALREKIHPRENPPLFTIGWARYAQDDEHRVLLIEEVQSDAGAVESKVKSRDERDLLKRYGIHRTKYESLFSLLRPYSDRLYEDAIGLVFQEAEALDYTVEMLSYEDKTLFDKAPRSVYIDLPKRMGLSQKRYSQLPMQRPFISTEQGYVEFPPNPVRHYTPNPGKPHREENAGSTATRTDETLWRKIVAKVKASDKGGNAGEWSARKAQFAVHLYKEAGGGYVGEKSEDNSLTNWTRQNWRTKSGKPSLETGERYLPEAAIESLTDREYEHTSRLKREGMAHGRQFVPQPPKIAAKVAQSREANPPAVNERSVNRALEKAGVPIVILSRNGYKSVESTDLDGPADIKSIYVPYWGDWTLEQWVQEATDNYKDALKRWE